MKRFAAPRLEMETKKTLRNITLTLLMAAMALISHAQIATILPKTTPKPAPKAQPAAVGKKDNLGSDIWKNHTADIVYRSVDGGQTWQDIGYGLPEKVETGNTFVTENGLYLQNRGEFYLSSNTTVPAWKKVSKPGEYFDLAPMRTGLIAFTSDGHIMRHLASDRTWTPVFTSFKGTQVYSVFESDKQATFIGTEAGLYKSADGGKTWKMVTSNGWVRKVVESNGVLLSTSMRGILRSADGGESWTPVISEGGVGIDLKNIPGGFAAITYNTESETRRVRTSYDGGKTWQAIDTALPASPMISSVLAVGEYLYCGHPDGIYRSTDKGKTWKMILPSPEGKVFELITNGNVVYAVAKAEGC